MLAAGWVKVYHPGAAVLHAHDYGAVEFMRRYFDEYRGLRETTGHVEPFGVARRPCHVRREVAADRRWMAEHGVDRRERARWTRALAGPPRRPARVLGARLALRARARRRCADVSRSSGEPAERRPARQRTRAQRRPSGDGDGACAPCAARAPRCRPEPIERKLSGRGLRRGRARSGATVRRRCSIPCPAWPSASACAWRW